VRFGVVGNGPPLVCVHGTPWSSFNMRHLIGGLAGQHTVYFYDLLGYGQSSMALGDVSLGVQGELLARLLDHWQLAEPVVVGHDFGGATSLRAHLLNGCSFSRLVLIDPVAVAPWGSPFFSHVRTHERAFAGVPGYIHEAIVRAYVQTAAHRPLTSEVLDRTVRPWIGSEGQQAFYRQIAQADQRFTDEVQPLYPGISIPVLVLWARS
jgi:pimeloyl-ACP methyl ester carboxylesterase